MDLSLGVVLAPRSRKETHSLNFDLYLLLRGTFGELNKQVSFSPKDGKKLCRGVGGVIAPGCGRYK